MNKEVKWYFYSEMSKIQWILKRKKKSIIMQLYKYMWNSSISQGDKTGASLLITELV